MSKDNFNKNKKKIEEEFSKPTQISDELRKFLGKESKAMARREVTKEINEYIRANNLQDKDNGRKINPDTALQKLLKFNGNKGLLTYFNLQTYLNDHFDKQS